MLCVTKAGVCRHWSNGKLIIFAMYWSIVDRIVRERQKSSASIVSPCGENLKNMAWKKGRRLMINNPVYRL